MLGITLDEIVAADSDGGPAASLELVRRAYRSAALKCHPDRAQQAQAGSSSSSSSSSESFVLVQKAFDLLSSSAGASMSGHDHDDPALSTRKNAAHSLSAITECMRSMNIVPPTGPCTHSTSLSGDISGRQDSRAPQPACNNSNSMYHKDSEAMYRVRAQLAGTLAGFPVSDQNPTGGVDLANLRKRWRQIWGQQGGNVQDQQQQKRGGKGGEEEEGQESGAFFADLPDHKKVEGYGPKLKTLAELLSKWRDVVKVERRGPGKTWVTGLISQVQIIAACKRLADAAYVPDPGT